MLADAQVVLLVGLAADEQGPIVLQSRRGEVRQRLQPQPEGPQRQADRIVVAAHIAEALPQGHRLVHPDGGLKLPTPFAGAPVHR